MPLLKGIAGTIGWLASSLAGIGAILYGSGYLAATAHAHLLGVGSVLVLSHDRYLQAGGEFFVAIAAELLQVMLVLVIALAVVAAGPAIIVLAGFAALRHWLPEGLARARERLSEFVERRSVWLRAGGCISLFGALLWIAVDPSDFIELFKVADLLLIDPQALSGKAAILLMSGDAGHLDAVFSRCLYVELAVTALTLAVWRLAAGWRLQLLVASPFVITSILYLVLLPMLFGILKHQIAFPKITISPPGEFATAPAGGDLFLLNKSENDFVLYDATARKLIWLPKDAVKALVVTGVAPLLHRSVSTAVHGG
jgi:hypothetical protein